MIHHRHHVQTLSAGQIRMTGKLLESIGGSVFESAEAIALLAGTVAIVDLQLPGIVLRH
jgi:hypothetical protein